jgi:hypothetical protein
MVKFGEFECYCVDMFSKDAEVRRLLMSADPGNLVNHWERQGSSHKEIYGK